MEFINRSSEEWLNMWSDLADYPLNNGDPLCPFMGVSWEYMGSTQDHHHFRHKKHPATGATEYVYIERRVRAVAWA